MGKVKEILLRQRSESRGSFGPERSFNENYIKPIAGMDRKLPVRASISHAKNKNEKSEVITDAHKFSIFESDVVEIDDQKND